LEQCPREPESAASFADRKFATTMSDPDQLRPRDRRHLGFGRFDLKESFAMAKKKKAAKPAAKKSPKKKGAKAAKKSTAKKPTAKKSPKKKASKAKKPAASPATPAPTMG
jgi:hypothetical protein